MKQKDAVYNAIKSVLTENGISFEDGMDVAGVLTKEMRGQVNEILCVGFQTQTIALDVKYDDADLKSYCSGLLSNWVRKDKRLNGNTKYEAKNPGSRTGTGDPAVKAMRQLLKIHPGDTEILTALEARLTEIGASKAKSITVDYDHLPEALRNKFKA